MYKYLAVFFLVLLMTVSAFAQKQPVSPRVNLTFDIDILAGERLDTKSIGANYTDCAGLITVVANDYDATGAGEDQENEDITCNIDVLGLGFYPAQLLEGPASDPTTVRGGGDTSDSVPFHNKTVYSSYTVSLTHNSDSNENAFYFHRATGSFIITSGTPFTPVND